MLWQTRVNPAVAELERRRRQSVLKFGILACCGMLILDSLTHIPGSSGDSGTSGAQGTLRGVASKKKDYEEVTHNQSLLITDCLFPTNTSAQAWTALAADLDISGMFRGEWHMINSSDLPNSNSNSNSNRSSNISVPLESQSQSRQSGRLMMQLKSVVIKNLDPLRYVYGLLRIFSDSTSISGTGSIMLPVQGVLEVASNRITLLSTPLTSQYIAMKPHEADIAAAIRRRRDALALNMNSTATRRLTFKYPKILGSNLVDETTNSSMTRHGRVYETDIKTTKAGKSEQAQARRALVTYFGPNSTEVELSRVEIEKIFSDRGMHTLDWFGLDSTLLDGAVRLLN